MKERKTPQNELHLILPSHSVNEGVARAAAALFLSQLNPTVTELSDVKCAVSEAVTNCIVHAYKNGIGDIYITLRIYEGREFRVEIRDRGCGISDVNKARQPLYTTDTESERSGMGFTIMESFMDSVRVISTPGAGTKVVMTKRLAPLPRIGK